MTLTERGANDNRAASQRIKSCRSCGRRGLETILSLGCTPLADGLLKEEQLVQPEPTYPLDVAFCPDCSLVQILDTVPPEVLFCQDYPYYSSTSETLLRHSRQTAARLIESRNLDSGNLVVEIASNDGYMLKNFVERGIPVLGIDPAQGPVQVARKAGISTMCTFFSKDLARRLRDTGRRADVIIANNVLAHVADTNGLVEGIRILLKDAGIAVIEVPYVRDVVDHCEFDTIYHEHLCYFSVTALVSLLGQHGLFLNEVERIPIHGGSLRLYVEPVEAVGESARTLLEEEKAVGMDGIGYYRGFAERVQQIRDALLEMLEELKRDGKRIAAYGAAAKGSTLINYVGIGKELIDFVVDRNPHKQGRYMPGKHLPIYPPAKLVEEMPDYVLLLTWNFRDEILEQQAEYRRKGGRFIVPVPHPVVV